MNKPSPVVPAEIAKLLDALPGLVGAVDRALFDATGVKTPFMIVAFANGSAAHATNIMPAENGMKALKELTDNFDFTDESGHATH
jgi:hypothetical protein